MKKFTNDAAHKPNGQKHRDDGQSCGQHGQSNFLCALHGRLKRGLAHLHMAHDVLTHHNGVVNQQAHAQRQGHERHHVEGEAQHVHEQKRPNDGNGQREPRDDGGAPRI